MRARCQELLCRRIADVRVVSTELGEMTFERAQKGSRGVWLEGPRRDHPMPCRRVYALLLRGGYAETSLPRPRAVSPTFCIFLDCAAVEAALGGDAHKDMVTLLDCKTDVLRRNDKLARRCWTCGVRCGVTECSFRECARCGVRGHVRASCRAGYPKEVQ